MRARKLIPIISFALFLSYFNQSFSQIKKDRKSVKYAKTIKAEELKEKLYIYASDEFEGRGTLTKGQELAIKFLEDHYVSNNINPTGCSQKSPETKPTLNFFGLFSN